MIRKGKKYAVLHDGKEMIAYTHPSFSKRPGITIGGKQKITLKRIRIECTLDPDWLKTALARDQK